MTVPIPVVDMSPDTRMPLTASPGLSACSQPGAGFEVRAPALAVKVAKE